MNQSGARLAIRLDCRIRWRAPTRNSAREAAGTRQERPHLIQTGLDVRLSDLDQRLEELRNKQEEAEQRRPRRLVGAQATGQESQAPRETRLALRGEPGQVLRRAKHEEIHGSQVAPLLRRQLPERPVEAIEEQRIIVDEVEEDRVQDRKSVV